LIQRIFITKIETEHNLGAGFEVVSFGAVFQSELDFHFDNQSWPLKSPSLH